MLTIKTINGQIVEMKFEHTRAFNAHFFGEWSPEKGRYLFRDHKRPNTKRYERLWNKLGSIPYLNTWITNDIEQIRVLCNEGYQESVIARLRLDLIANDMVFIKVVEQAHTEVPREMPAPTGLQNHTISSLANDIETLSDEVNDLKDTVDSIRQTLLNIATTIDANV
jgi:hypothetical protein